MSKLSIVRTTLLNSTGIQVVSVEENSYFSNPYVEWAQTFEFIVAPNQGIYTADELQRFMMSLVPCLEPTCKDDFQEYTELLRLGRLYFDENVGTETVRREITITEPDFLPDGVVENDKTVLKETRKLRRRIWVRLYPDPKVALVAVQYKHEIPKTDLSRFRGRGRTLSFPKCMGG